MLSGRRKRGLALSRLRKAIASLELRECTTQGSDLLTDVPPPPEASLDSPASSKLRRPKSRVSRLRCRVTG
eukprot:5865814-Pyramimonas_sp.AAC.1